MISALSLLGPCIAESGTGHLLDRRTVAEENDLKFNFANLVMFTWANFRQSWLRDGM
jgi:hypothetical protein